MALALIVALLGCSEEKPPSMTTSELRKEREALAKKQKKHEKKAAAAAGEVVPEGESNLEDEGFAAVEETYIYDPDTKRDPFRSFLLMAKQEDEDAENSGPLAEFELSQLSVAAVIWTAKRPRALVTVPGGRSFIIKEGSPIGKNKGRVIHIGDNLVLVKETYVDFAGEQTTKDVELRIRRSQGG